MKLIINNKAYDIKLQPEETLLNVLREELHLTGTKRGCDIGLCGTCTVLINGQVKRACKVTVKQLKETDNILTIEGLSKGGKIHPIQQAFIDADAIQCGFCTPGMVLATKALLDKNPKPSRDEIKRALQGNLCRCTGYQQIFDAVELASKRLLTKNWSIKYLKIALIVFLLSFIAQAAEAGKNTKILVVGTIHDAHEGNPSYSYEDVYRIIKAYDPDVVCMETRPQDFRKHGEFPEYKEMMIASLYAIKNRKEACPIEWFPDGVNYLSEKKKLAKTPEYIRKIKKFEELQKKSTIIRDFEGRHPRLWEDNDAISYALINGREYNVYQADVARIKLEVFGDDLYNANYITRNGKMFELLKKAVDENSGKKIIVITGASHKHYFDERLSGLKHVKVVDFQSILPLKKGPIDPDIENYIATDKTDLYYLK